MAFFLGKLLQKAKTIREADQIVLCGATPFAKNVLKHREYLFSDCVNIKIEDFNDENICSGRVYLLCSRPNISRHLEYLSQIPAENIFSYQLLLLLEPRYSVDPYAYQYEKIVKQIEDIVDHSDDYYWIYLGLADEKSKEIFMKMILFRLTYDPKMHTENATRYPHYFDADIVSLGQEEIFVDCGGYIGDTLEVFKELTGNRFKKYYLFEPNEKLIALAKTKGDQRVAFINKGVWECETTLYFRMETAPGNGSFFYEKTDMEVTEVPVTSIDAGLDEATFIKMDVEGSELNALKGARKVIGKCHPILAVCVYHKYVDFRELYDFIQSLGEYNIYLRAEMNNIDTELYYLCVPQKI